MMPEAVVKDMSFAKTDQSGAMVEIVGHMEARCQQHTDHLITADELRSYLILLSARLQAAIIKSL